MSKKSQGVEIIHDDIRPVQLVIPGLPRNPVFSWIPAFAGMTTFGVIHAAVHITNFSFWILGFDIPLAFEL